MKYGKNIIPKLDKYINKDVDVIYSGNYIETEGYLAYNAFDHTIGIDNSRWASQASNCKYIGLHFKNESYKIRKYSIYGDFYSQSQSPISWNLEGSNNGKFSFNGGILNKDYFILDSITNQIGWKSCEKREFYIKNSNRYSYYVFTNMTSSSGVISISEIEMFEKAKTYNLLMYDNNYYSIKTNYDNNIHNYINLNISNVNLDNFIEYGFDLDELLKKSVYIKGLLLSPIDIIEHLKIKILQYIEE